MNLDKELSASISMINARITYIKRTQNWERIPALARTVKDLTTEKRALEFHLKCYHADLKRDADREDRMVNPK